MNLTKSVIELASMLFVSSFNWTSARRNPTLFGPNPLHGIRIKWQKVVSSIVFVLSTTVRNTSRRMKVGANLTGVNGRA